MYSRIFLSVLCTAALGACGTNPSPSSDAGTGTTGETEIETPVIINPPDSVYAPQTLLWEGEHPEAVFWSAILYRTMGSPDVFKVLEGSDDIADFCPKYFSLNEFQKVNVWAFLISGIAKYESGFNPFRRRLDDDGEADEVTGKAMFREGLLQLSYKLRRLYAFCDFDWEKDKKKNEQDPTRSIFNAVTNITCGAKLLAKQIETKGQIAHNGSFWQVLRKNGRFSAIPQIKALTRQLPFCSGN